MPSKRIVGIGGNNEKCCSVHYLERRLFLLVVCEGCCGLLLTALSWEAVRLCAAAAAANCPADVRGSLAAAGAAGGDAGVANPAVVSMATNTAITAPIHTAPAYISTHQPTTIRAMSTNNNTAGVILLVLCVLAQALRPCRRAVCVTLYLSRSVLCCVLCTALLRLTVSANAQVLSPRF